MCEAAASGVGLEEAMALLQSLAGISAAPVHAAAELCRRRAVQGDLAAERAAQLLETATAVGLFPRAARAG